MNGSPIEVKMSNHQIAMARIYAMYLMPLKERTGWFVLALVLLFSLGVRYLFYPEAGWDSAGELLLGALILGGSWFLLVYTRERGNHAAARMYAEGFQLTQKDEGLEYRVGESAEILKWSEFHKVKTTPRWIFVYFNPRFALFIPRESFARQEDYNAWAQNLSKRIAG